MEIKLKNLENCGATQKRFEECSAKGNLGECSVTQELNNKAQVTIDYNSDKKGDGFLEYQGKDGALNLYDVRLQCADQHTEKLVPIKGSEDVLIEYKYPNMKEADVYIDKTVGAIEEDKYSDKFEITLLNPKVFEALPKGCDDTNCKSITFKLKSGTEGEWQSKGKCQKVNVEDQDQGRQYQGGSFCLKTPEGSKYNIVNLCDANISANTAAEVELELGLCDHSVGGTYISDNIEIVGM